MVQKSREQFTAEIVSSDAKTKLIRWLAQNYPPPAEFRSYHLSDYPDAEFHPTIHQWMFHYFHAGLLERTEPGKYRLVEGIGEMLKKLYPDT